MAGGRLERKRFTRKSSGSNTLAQVPSDHCRLSVVPLLLAERRCIGVLGATHDRPEWFSEHHLELSSLIARIAAPYLEVARLKKLVQYDPLTGLLSRRGLDEWLSKRRRGEALAVAAFDLDYFKRVNDTWGHAVGDVTLRATARVLSAFVRSDDAVGRMGGEEFTIFFPGMSTRGAFDRAEAIRLAFERSPLDADGRLLPLTVSAGVAARDMSETIDSVLERADRALYAAKSISTRPLTRPASRSPCSMSGPLARQPRARRLALRYC